MKSHTHISTYTLTNNPDPSPPQGSPKSIDVANPIEVDPLQGQDADFHPPKRQPMLAKIGHTMDKNTLKAFLTSKHCLKGVRKFSLLAYLISIISKALFYNVHLISICRARHIYLAGANLR